nr:transposase [uncultured archaeon]
MHKIFAFNPLMQYKITYTVDRKRNAVHIQKLGKFRVEGLDQIPENAELTTANLIERNGDYYLHITAYIPKGPKVENKKTIGIDLGVKDQVTFSNGVKVSYSVPQSERLKKLQHYFSRAKKGSKNREKLRLKISKEYEHENSIKKDITNKIVHYVVSNYQYVVFQDDDIHSWQKLYGKKILETSIGGIRDALKRKASTPIEVDRFVKTTGVYLVCGNVVEMKLSDREFTCPSCSSWFGRDVASALVIKDKGLCLWNAGETPGDDRASTSSMMEYLQSIPHVKASAAMNREALTARSG